MLLSLFPALLALIALTRARAQDTETPPKQYHYPQPPLPTVQAVRDPAAWTLDPSFDITNVSVCTVLPLPLSVRRQLKTVNKRVLLDFGTGCCLARWVPPEDVRREQHVSGTADRGE